MELLRSKVIDEIITSEETYYEDLLLLVKAGLASAIIHTLSAL